MTWRNDAACAGLDTDVFFIDDMKPYTLALCDACPVKGACLDDALSYPHGMDYGVWGGTSRNERERLRAS